MRRIGAFALGLFGVLTTAGVASADVVSGVLEERDGRLPVSTGSGRIFIGDRPYDFEAESLLHQLRSLDKPALAALRARTGATQGLGRLFD